MISVHKYFSKAPEMSSFSAKFCPAPPNKTTDGTAYASSIGTRYGPVCKNWVFGEIASPCDSVAITFEENLASGTQGFDIEVKGGASEINQIFFFMQLTLPLNETSILVRQHK